MLLFYSRIPWSGEKPWRLSDADSSFLPENKAASVVELAFLQRRTGMCCAETQRTQPSLSETPKKEEDSPRAGPEPWDVLCAKRNLILAGTTIHAPKQDAHRRAPTALQRDRNSNHGFNSLASHQAKASGHPANPSGKGGNRKARNTSHASRPEDSLEEEECGRLASPQGLPRLRAHGLQPQAQHLNAWGQASLQQDSEKPTARGQSRPTAVPTPGLRHSLGQQGAETTKGAFQANAPGLQHQRRAWATRQELAAVPYKPSYVSHTGATEGNGL